jgi:Co/Zn/Cd efflux system component
MEPSDLLLVSRMSAHCCPVPAQRVVDAGFRRVLGGALVLNAVMFAVELGASWVSGSVSLLADSIDFFGDAANYALSLAVLGLSLSARATAALVKAASMGAFGMFVLAQALWNLQTGVVPSPATMGAVGFAALVVNAGVAWMLYRYRAGDANMRSVWICTRNDVLGNVAVMLAALGVFGTGNAWPDLVVAAVMAVLALWGAATVVGQARKELQTVASPHGA